MIFEELKELIKQSIDEKDTPIDIMNLIINKVYQKGYEDGLAACPNSWPKIDNQQTTSKKPEENTIKPLKYTGFCSHSCESWYKCPICGKEYGSWQFFHKGGTKGWFDIAESGYKVEEAWRGFEKQGFVCDCGQRVYIPKTAY